MRLAIVCLAAGMATACATAPRVESVGMSSASAGTDAGLTVMTFNIRYGTASDGENSWQNRRDLLVETVKKYQPDILGTQEGLDFQLEYIQERLGDGYAWFGVARDADGTGEHAAVFYRKDRLTPVESGNFWISERPSIPGTKSWGSHHNRVTTWARFADRASGRQFVYFNTHLDNGSEEARQEGARMLAERAAATPAPYPVIITGDFNAPAGSSEPWLTLTRAGLTDAWLAAAECKGPACTFGGFKPPVEDADRRIDWILVSKGLEVASCETVTENRDGRYPSDHFPVVARIGFAR